MTHAEGGRDGVQPIEVYGRLMAAELPRVLGGMDRDPTSPTVGCCDRNFWAWKFVDFPGARFQEALCVLSFAARHRVAPEFHGNRRVLEWIEHGFRFWSSIQHRDGSFDEAYPYERSLAATAFTTFYASEALEFLGELLPNSSRTSALETISRAGHWLCHHDESHGVLSNHLAAAAAALAHASRLLNIPTFEARSRYFLDRILSHQSSEGWYEEYGGADPGYQTHGSFYLARLHQLTGDDRLLQSLRSANRFLAHFVHPDGSIGGEYASRDTQTYYPAAFEMLAPHDPSAAWISSTLRPRVGTASAAGLKGIDQYNFYPCLNNLVFAHLAVTNGRPAATPREGIPSGTTWFPQAGLVRVRTSGLDAVIGTSKGGVVKVFDRVTRRLVLSDCGYAGRSKTGGRLSSQYLDHHRTVKTDTDGIEVTGPFMAYNRPTMRPWRFLGFRIFSLTFGRVSGIGEWLKRVLVKVLIYRRKPLRLTLRRRIRFGVDSVTIEDSLAGPDAVKVADLARVDSFGTIHMGSARYFVASELHAAGTTTEPVPLAQLSQGMTLTRTVDVELGS
jgi:hypothetical protein